MGLDMYLIGRKFNAGMEKPKDDEGYEIEEIVVRLGYWRKHANLHGYIVQHFADGRDECQNIELSMENLEQLLKVVKKPTEMEKTKGFFFGESANDDEQIKDDVAILTKAVGFLAAGTVRKESVWRSVVYRASW